MATEYTFAVEKQCPVCGEKTPVIKVKSRLIAERVDNDYCCHYKGFNPYLYHIWVCDKCGYAADEKNFLAVLPDRKKEALVKFLHKHKVHFEFHDVRSIPDGIASLQLAIYCAEAMDAPIARRAGMELRMAWIYRIIKDQANEKKHLSNSLQLYERSYVTERYPIDSLTDSTVMYLIGVLHEMLGNRERAVLYLSRLVSDKSIKASGSKIYQDARRIWQDIRAENKDAKEEK